MNILKTWAKNNHLDGACTLLMLISPHPSLLFLDIVFVLSIADSSRQDQTDNSGVFPHNISQPAVESFWTDDTKQNLVHHIRYSTNKLTFFKMLIKHMFPIQACIGHFVVLSTFAWTLISGIMLVRQIR